MVENGPTPYYLKFSECFVTGDKWPFAFRLHVTFETFRRKRLPFGKRRKTVRYIDILLRKLGSSSLRAGFNCQDLQSDKKLMYCVLKQ